MKKLILFLICILVLTGCDNAKLSDTQNNDQNNGENNQTGDSSEYDSEYFKQITFSEFKEIYKKDQASLIYFGSDGCSACLSFKPNAKQFAKENKINVYFVLLDNFSTEDQAALSEIVEFQYIPFVTVFKNGKVLYSESGVHTVEQLKDLASEYSITK